MGLDSARGTFSQCKGAHAYRRSRKTSPISPEPQGSPKRIGNRYCLKPSVLAQKPRATSTVFRVDNGSLGSLNMLKRICNYGWTILSWVMLPVYQGFVLYQLPQGNCKPGSMQCSKLPICLSNGLTVVIHFPPRCAMCEPLASTHNSHVWVKGSRIRTSCSSAFKFEKWDASKF